MRLAKRVALPDVLFAFDSENVRGLRILAKRGKEPQGVRARLFDIYIGRPHDPPAPKTLLLRFSVLRLITSSLYNP